MTTERSGDTLSRLIGPGIALVVVDVQNDFADPSGNLYVDGGDEAIPLINEMIDNARERGAFVAYTQDWHPRDTPHFDTHGGPWPAHCVAGTWGAELHPDLRVAGPIVRKGTGNEDGYSGFTARDVVTGDDVATGLQHLLDNHDVTSVVVVGLAQDVCVAETALDARRLGYDTTVPLAATRPVAADATAVKRSLETLRAAGVELIDS